MHVIHTLTHTHIYMYIYVHVCVCVCVCIPVKQGGAFAVITRIIKLLNHPTLLLRQEKAPVQPPDVEDETDLTLGAAAAACVAVDMEFVKRHFPAEYDPQSLVHSSKLRFVFDLLKQVQSSTADRCVLVSNYTTTLDLLETFCTASQYAHMSKVYANTLYLIISSYIMKVCPCMSISACPGSWFLRCICAGDSCADFGGVAGTSTCGSTAAYLPINAEIWWKASTGTSLMFLSFF